MKTPRILALAFACVFSNAHGDYTNFIRQVQLPAGVQWDASVAEKGQRNSLLAIATGGARFELWTVRNAPLASYLLDTRFVSAFSPEAEVTIRSEDPYDVVPRTRADRPFFVDVKVDGLISGQNVPASGKSVRLLRHVQSYGRGGVGENINRSQATLLSQATIAENGSRTLTYAITSIPSANLTKTTGEERFSVFSVADEFGGSNQLASRYIQIWPMADGLISGITNGEIIRFKVPDLTVSLNDLYPSSDTYVQVYPGPAKANAEGTRLMSFVCDDSVPKNRVLTLQDYGTTFDTDGAWTMEVLTVTPFGIDRLHHVTFEVNRTLKVNGTLSTIE